MYVEFYDKIRKETKKEFYHSYYLFEKRIKELKKSPYYVILEMSNLYD